jgi:DNA-binding IclR family transcriptional regulator
MHEAARTRSVPVLTRALGILEILAASRSGLALPEVARRAGIPKSSAHCILLTLLRQGYVSRSPRTRRYVCSSKLLWLANQALEGLRLRELALPFLRQLCMGTGLSAHMAILENNEAMLIAKIDPPGAPPLSTWPGRRMELHCTGVGKALLAYIPDEDLRQLLKVRAFSRHNDNTITSPKRLLQQAQAIRAAGYAVDDEEDEVGYRCLGVPVFDEQGRVAAAISVAGSVSQVNDEKLKFLAGQLKRAADAITASLTEEERRSDESLPSDPGQPSTEPAG